MIPRHSTKKVNVKLMKTTYVCAIKQGIDLKITPRSLRII